MLEQIITETGIKINTSQRFSSNGNITAVFILNKITYFHLSAIFSINVCQIILFYAWCKFYIDIYEYMICYVEENYYFIHKQEV